MSYEGDRRTAGQYGCELIADTAAHTGLNLWMVEVVEAATFTVLTADDVTGDKTGTEWPAGTRIPGTITAITLSGGKVVGYKAA